MRHKIMNRRCSRCSNSISKGVQDTKLVFVYAEMGIIELVVVVVVDVGDVVSGIVKSFQDTKFVFLYLEMGKIDTVASRIFAFRAVDYV